MSKILGCESLMKKLNQIGNINPIIDRTMGKQVQLVRGVAVKLCPADKGELRRSILGKTEVQSDKVIGTVYTNKEYAPYVEFGTGPTGESNHAGISPEVNVSYSQEGWGYQDNDGEWHYTNGQAAQPFLYPALKSMERVVSKNIGTDLQASIKERI